MAGIAGIFGAEAQKEVVEAMLKKMAYRGPGRSRTLKADGFVLGCCKMDYGLKHTQAAAANEDTALVFDGNTYVNQGRQAESAEELLNLFTQHGGDCFQHIDGIYAAAVANREELLLARDHVGTKPIFYGVSHGTVYFASELKALADFVEKVEELPAGKVFSSKDGVKNFPVFLPDVPTFETSDEAQNILRTLLEKATASRMGRGVINGVGLSGGLDSSIIAALAHRIDPDLELFTIGLEGSPDISNAKLMAKHLGAQDRHHIHIITEGEIEPVVLKAVWHLESFEEDCISGCIANMFTSKLASEYTNVCLCGEGSDELLGGYHLLKRILDDEKRQAMMDKLVAIAYNTALRRLDRGWLANSVEYRTPFLDQRVIAFSKKIPVIWKIFGPQQIEKWILREAFRDMLPPEIVDRPKLRFAAGAGVDDIMDRIAAKHVSQEEFEANKTTRAGYQLNSPKELWYYKIFKELFPRDSYEEQVARWDPYK